MPELKIFLSRSQLAFKAIRQLGLDQLRYYARYKLGLRTGEFNRKLGHALARLNKLDKRNTFSIHACLASLPDRKTIVALVGTQATQITKEADEIVRGYVRLFGGPAIPLDLLPPSPLQPWMNYEDGSSPISGKDIKIIWEPARFGWACKLAMAYHLTRDERYSEVFWHYTERFINSNHPYLGPHWSSAQEVAIRLVALLFAHQAFAESRQTTSQRLQMLARSIAIHAERIPPTLAYARSQNNNHLITEAVGLYTASAALPDHPRASIWHKLGWKLLNEAFQAQISPDGTYIQHSTNYHRLALQAALWTLAVQAHAFPSEPFPTPTLDRLGSATRWLWRLLDPESGHVPNLGHNDGAYILPLTIFPYNDYRPVIYASVNAFLNTRILPPGPWEDMSAWLGFSGESGNEVELSFWRLPSTHAGAGLQSPYILVNQKSHSWVNLRVAEYHARPAHADQLHLDLWWQGLNLAQDPGTYRYNAPSPWENSFTSTLVHNTVSVDNLESMQRISRFLYLDWAQGRITASKPSKDGGWESISAQHDGYRELSINHSRVVTTFPDGHWEILDLVDGPQDKVHTARLHWLLPDWESEIYDLSSETSTPSYGVRLHSPKGWIWLKISSPSFKWTGQPSGINFQVARAGEILHGPSAVSPITGWTSPTYGDKIPALACIAEITQALPIDLKSEWILPAET